MDHCLAGWIGAFAAISWNGEYLYNRNGRLVVNDSLDWAAKSVVDFLSVIVCDLGVGFGYQ